MRHLLALALLALSCAADPVLLPDASGVPDAGPCGGACGLGTVCAEGACVAVDAGADVPVAVDRGASVDVLTVVDVGVDAGVADAGADVPRDVDPRQSEVCRGVLATCDGRSVNVQGGEQDGGRTYHCGGCGVSCSAGEFCVNCACER